MHTVQVPQPTPSSILGIPPTAAVSLLTANGAFWLSVTPRSSHRSPSPVMLVVIPSTPIVPAEDSVWRDAARCYLGTLRARRMAVFSFAALARWGKQVSDIPAAQPRQRVYGVPW